MAAMHQMAESLGHEILNSLGLINSSTFILRMTLEQAQDQKILKHLDLIQEEIRAARRLVTDAVSFSGSDALIPATASLKSLIEAAVKGVPPPKGIKIVQEFPEAVPVLCDAELFREALMHIIRNAFEAMPGGGTLYIRAQINGKKLNLEFQDSGPGIPKDVAANIFKPFRSNKSRALGVGLAHARRVVQLHRGSIKIQSKLNKGTTVKIQVPAQ